MKFVSSNMPRASYVLLGAIFGVSLFSLSLFGQASGRILGAVTDQSGAVISGAEVSMVGMINSTASAQRYIFGRAGFAYCSTTLSCGHNSVARGDFNGDRKLDLAVPISGNNTVSILLGKPDGTFPTHVAYETGSAPVAAAVGDFNRDGKLDLATANSDGTVSVLLGNGDGTFQTHIEWAAGSGPVSVKAGDFNGDGKLDLVTANSSGNTVSILLGRGDGTFHTPVDYATGTSPLSVITGDFNGDGKPDLATVANGGGLSILLGNGDGTFQTHVDYASGFTLVWVATGDFNGDGKLDLVAANNDSRPPDSGVVVLLGNGNGTFQSPVFYSVASPPVSVAVGDFNGDGNLDLAASSFDVFGSGNSFSILLGKGDGTFPTAAVYFAAGAGQVIVSDFSGDGKLDLAIDEGKIAIYLNQGDGTFPTQRDYLASRPASVTAGDFNGDGKLDLATPGVSVLLGKGDGTFQTHVDYTTGPNAVSVRVGDFNGDGKLDLATANSNSGLNTVSILLGNGDGTFQAHVDYATGPSPVSMTVGDFNGDGKLDLATANSADNTVSILLGKGDGTFQAHVDYATGPNPKSVARGDFNGDGKQDLAIANNSDNTVSILLGKGNGTFQTHVDYATGSGPASVAVSDFNGDGKLDLAVANSIDANTVSIMLGNGDGTFQAHVDYASGPSPILVTVGDFNGDGKPDLATANVLGVSDHGGNTVSILLDNGDGTFQDPVTLRTNSEPTSVIARDFFGAGGVDLAAGISDGSIEVRLNTPVIALFPTKLSFGKEPVGTTSGPRTVLLSNPSGTPLRISSIAVNGADAADFAQTNNCDAKVKPGANCAVSVTFVPKESGTRTAAITIMDNALARLQTVALAGCGTVVELVPSSLSFGYQDVGTKSHHETVMLTNTGGTTLHFSGISIVGTNAADFSEKNTCGSGVGAGESCRIRVTFEPKAKGPRSAAVSIGDNGGCSPQRVPVFGTGT